MILVIHREIKAKFYMVPIDFNGFWSSFTPKTCDVSDIMQMRGGDDNSMSFDEYYK